MKKFCLLFLFAFLSCSHPAHKLAPNTDGLESIEYCGGDMWGYVGPLPVDKKKGTYETAFSGVAYLDSNRKTLLFTYALEIYGDVDIEFEKNQIQVEMNGKPITQKAPLEVAVHRIPYGPYEHYPSNKYSLRLLDPRKNQWEVTKLNPVFKHFFTGKPEVVTLPKTQTTVIKNGKFHFPHEKEVKKTMLISVIPMWPLDKPLADVEIKTKIPALSFRGKEQDVQEFNFSFNLKNWETRAKSGKTRCPSLEELFRWKR